MEMCASSRNFLLEALARGIFKHSSEKAHLAIRHAQSEEWRCHPLER